MTTNLPELESAISLARTFLEKYGERLKESEAFLHVSTGVSLLVAKQDTAIAGKCFGKDGWTRHFNRFLNGRIEWNKVVDGVGITISDAEDLPLEGSPVPASAFPIQIEDAP